MQFGREQLPQIPPARPLDGERGWVCSENPSHFQLASERGPRGAAATSVPQARWDDDGGSTPGKLTIDSRP